jgi:hypothetical protein
MGRSFVGEALGDLLGAWDGAVEGVSVGPFGRLEKRIHPFGLFGLRDELIYLPNVVDRNQDLPLSTQDFNG